MDTFYLHVVRRLNRGMSVAKRDRAFCARHLDHPATTPVKLWIPVDPDSDIVVTSESCALSSQIYPTRASDLQGGSGSGLR